MALVKSHMSVSLDGFVAGPDQSRENPLGRGGLALHTWHFDADEPGHDVDAHFRDEILAGRGAFVMGRNMYGPIRGEWGDEDWRGWWGPEPPYHAPVYVLTHHAHDPIEMAGGTTFFFVTTGFTDALDAARAAAGDRDVDIAGGASTVAQALRENAIDELTLDIAPVLLGSGERLFADVPPLDFEPVEVAHSPYATHVRYRFTHS
jgi:dihydrofolate reductase